MTETPALLISVIFLSCIFQPFTFVRYIPVLHYPPPDISLSVIFLYCIFSAPPFLLVSLSMADPGGGDRAAPSPTGAGNISDYMQHK